MKKYMKAFCIATVAFMLAFCGIFNSYADEKTALGTKENPYLIENADDLLKLSYDVENGNEFKDRYFRQTADIDLLDVEWNTVGKFESQYHFFGIYDGNGHVIRNLNAGQGGNNAFFGALGGIVMNLGIVDGKIKGTCIGSFTSHAIGSNAAIINCYSISSVEGVRAGGIADNFNGAIANCWTMCELISKGKTGGIVSYSAKMTNNCFAVEETGRSLTMPEGCEVIDSESPDFTSLAEKLNRGIFESAEQNNIDFEELNFWKVSNDGKSVTFSDEKAHFKTEYAFDFLLPVIKKYIPHAFIVVSVALFIVVTAKTKKKEAAPD